MVTKGAEEESPSVLSQLCPPEVDLVMSSQAWADYAVPGSPYVVVADGRTGRVKGEGSGTSFSQVGGLIQQSDRRQPASGAGSTAGRRPAARARHRPDAASAGIGPNDPSLYGAAEQDER